MILQKLKWWFCNERWCRECHKMTPHYFNPISELQNCQYCQNNAATQELLKLLRSLDKGDSSVLYKQYKYEYTQRFIVYLNQHYLVSVNNSFFDKNTKEYTDLEDIFETYTKEFIAFKQKKKQNSSKPSWFIKITKILLLGTLAYLIGLLIYRLLH